MENIDNLSSFRNKSASLLVYGDLCGIKGYKKLRANHFSQYIYFETDEASNQQNSSSSSSEYENEKILPVDESDNNFNLLFMSDLMKKLNNTRK